MTTNQRLGSNLRYYRKQQDMTLKEMSDKLAISLATYSKYETGLIKHIDIEMVKEFARVLNVSPSVLLDWEGKKFDNNDLLEDYFISDQEVSNRNDTAATTEALELYKKYQNAIPEIQKAIDALLGNHEQNP